MAEMKVWCLLIDHEKKATRGNQFGVKVPADADIDDLTKAIKEERPVDLQHVDPATLTVWRCTDPKLLSTMNGTQLEKKLRDIDLTDVMKAKELAAGEAIKDLGLSDGELLLVQLPVLESILQDDDQRPHADEDTAPSDDGAALAATQKSWTSDYVGRSHVLLWQHICNYYKKSEVLTLYANMCAIVQSSGMGKSRTVDEFGKTHFLIPVNLRNGGSGYPPPDHAVREYLTENIRDKDVARGRCIGFLIGLFERALIELQNIAGQGLLSTKGDMILHFHQQMSPPENNTFRQNFFKDVLEIAENNEIATSKSDIEPGTPNKQATQKATLRRNVDINNRDEALKQRGKTSSGRDAAAKLVVAAEKLVEFLRNVSRTRKTKDEVQVVIAFDEAHVLCETVHTDLTTGNWPWSVFIMLRDVLRSLYNTPVWSLFLSTTGKLSQFNPHREIDPSMRIRDEIFITVPPFTTLRYDMFATQLKRMRDGRLRVSEGQPIPGQPLPRTIDEAKGKDLTLELVTRTEFIVRFGRPLFALLYHFGDKDTQAGILRFAMSKLICDDPVKFSTSWTTKIPLHVAFACLSQRLCLEFHRSAYNTDEETQIASHMRLCLKIAADHQYVVSSSGSEPLLAEAASTIMLLKEFKPAESLKYVLTGFFINKGDRGELVAMLSVTVARDLAVKTRMQSLNFSLPFSGQLLPSTEEQTPMFRAVKVYDFLDQLFKLECALDPSELKKISSDFKDAYIYFNHFIKPFTQATCTPHFLMQYMTRGAAVLCANNMPGIDLLFGILFKSGSRSKLRTNQMSSAMVQVKNDEQITYDNDADDIYDGMSKALRKMFRGTSSTWPVLRIVFSLASTPELKYKETEVLLECGTKIRCHDFWCGGFGQHFVPNRGESCETWSALADATMKMKEIFEEPGSTSKDFAEERRYSTPGANKPNGFWKWVYESKEEVEESEEEMDTEEETKHDESTDVTMEESNED